ncbi:MAG: hypothetical protein WD118_04710 [Phycisphaeraceae bacterium]
MPEMRFAILFLLSVMLVGPVESRAAVISEVFLGRHSGQAVPDAVELSGLEGGDTVQLVIVNADADAFGDVRQTFTVEVTQPVHLLSTGAWPTPLWGEADDGAVAEALLATPTLDLAGPRRLHLHAGVTGLSAGMNVFDGAMGEALANATPLLDILSFALGGDAVAAGDGPIIDLHEGWVIAKPATRDGAAGEQLVVGSPDADGKLRVYDPPFRVTPGLANPHWDGSHLPEPGAGMVAGAFLLTLLLRRSRPRRT